MKYTEQEAKAMARENRMKAESQIKFLLEQNTDLKVGESNFNALALQGWDMDDMEYVEEFGLPKEIAYTPDINDYMLDKIQTENERFYVTQDKETFKELK